MVKKISILLLFLTFMSVVLCQQIDRQFVLLEKFTGTWCSPCASSVPGLEEAVAAGCDFAIIAYQYKDPYANASGNARYSYYVNKNHLSGSVPFFLFDGEYTENEGSSYDKAYYKNAYDNKVKVKSPLFIEINPTRGLDDLNWNITVNVKCIDSEFQDLTNVKVFTVLTEGNIIIKWQTQNKLEHVERMVLPDAQGEQLILNNENIFQKTYPITVDQSWRIGHLEVITFVQNVETGEILQAYKTPLFQNLILTSPIITESIQIEGAQQSLIKWNAVTPVEGYELLGYNVFNGNEQILTTKPLQATQYISQKANSGKYCYMVTAVYKIGESPFSEKVCVDMAVLPPAENLQADEVENTGGKVFLKWTAPQGYEVGTQNAKYLAGYDVYRDFVKITTEPVTDLEYTDKVEENRTFEYYVVAQYENNDYGTKTTSVKSNIVKVDVVGASQGISDISDNVVNVYPNPVSGSIINVNEHFENYFISDITGKIILSGNFESSIIDVSALRSGTYFLNLQNNGKSKICKFVKL